MKKTITILIVMTLIGFAGLLTAEKRGTLENLLLPELLEISDGQVYCLQETTVYTYRLEDLKFLNKFCKKGEGPGELKINPGLSNYVIPMKDSVMVVGPDKAIIYSKTGILKKEFRLPSFPPSYLHPLKEDAYLGIKFDITTDQTKPRLIAAILNEKLEVKKELYSQDFSGGQNLVNLTADGINVAVGDGKIYIEESAKGFVVSIYDFDGKLIKKITKEMPRVKFTKAHEENALNQLKQNRALKTVGWENFKNMVKITHDEYLPLIQDMQVDQGLIYLMSTNFKEDKQEFLVMDQQGKILKKLYLPQPIPTDFVSVIFGRPTRFYKIYKGKYYYLKENLDEDAWELHVENI